VHLTDGHDMPRIHSSIFQRSFLASSTHNYCYPILMDIISQKGRTAVVHRVEEGLICKSPRSEGSVKFLAEIKNAFAVEKQLLERLGVHPGIVRYGPISKSMQS
jgi:hypothetical protein